MNKGLALVRYWKGTVNWMSGFQVITILSVGIQIITLLSFLLVCAYRILFFGFSCLTGKSIIEYRRNVTELDLWIPILDDLNWYCLMWWNFRSQYKIVPRKYTTNFFIQDRFFKSALLHWSKITYVKDFMK